MPSGDTTGRWASAAGLDARRVAQDQPDAAIVELGANDALRGIEPEATTQNLDAILTELNRYGIPVLLAGMRAPPNLGPEYSRRFDAIYPRLAQAHDVALYPFFLEGVAAVPRLNQDDGIHPNAKGIAEIVRRITPAASKPPVAPVTKAAHGVAENSLYHKLPAATRSGPSRLSRLGRLRTFGHFSPPPASSPHTCLSRASRPQLSR